MLVLDLRYVFCYLYVYEVYEHGKERVCLSVRSGLGGEALWESETGRI